MKNSQTVQVAVNAGEFGEAGVYLVGLPDAAVKESKDRVSPALANSGFRMPQTHTTINLAPGHLRKEGPCYDLPRLHGGLFRDQAVSTRSPCGRGRRDR